MEGAIKTSLALISPSTYVLNTQGEEKNTVFYLYLACFVNIFTLNT